MRSMMKVMVPVVVTGLLMSTVWHRQAQAEEQAIARIEAVIAAQPPPRQVEGTLADGADLARQVLSLRGQ